MKLESGSWKDDYLIPVIAAILFIAIQFCGLYLFVNYHPVAKMIDEYKRTCGGPEYPPCQ